MDVSNERQTTQLRHKLSQGKVIAVGAFNALVAKLIERAGFDAIYISGAGLANSAGLPDVGLLTMTEVAAEAKLICDSVSVPVILDADTGFGEAINVGRTVRDLEQVGLAGIHIEDQEFPKRCGHLPGKRLVSTEAMIEKIQAAKDARTDPDFLIIARTDARGVTNLEDAIQRAVLYVEAGADALFPDALHSAEELVAFSKGVGTTFATTARTPLLLANMTEFGKTPYLNVNELEALGYDLIIFPLTLMRIMLKSMDIALQDLKESGGQVKLLDDMMTREELYEVLDYQPEKNDENFIRGVV